jgi:hypothetical protein
MTAYPRWWQWRRRRHLNRKFRATVAAYNVLTRKPRYANVVDPKADR